MHSVDRERHEDDFTMLRYVVHDVDDIERFRIQRHLGVCRRCATMAEELLRVDEALRTHREEVFAVAADGLEPSDPFSARPEPPVRPPSMFGFLGTAFLDSCRQAGDSSASLRDSLLDADPSSELPDRLRRLDLGSLRDRYALGYALDEGPLRILRGPARWGTFAQAVIERLSREPYRPFAKVPAGAMTPAEFSYPLAELNARAQLLAGIVANWTGAYDAGARSFALAWRFAGEGKASEPLLATIELHEAQRRSFAGDARAAVLLARRACATFAAHGLADDVARANHALGIALSTLDQDEEALVSFRSACEQYAASGLWNPYSMALNSIGYCLLKLGRLDEAKREYAKALRLAQTGTRPALVGFVRYNLYRTLLAGGKAEEALRGLRSVQGLFGRLGLVAEAFGARLHELEALARLGRLPEAQEALDALREAVRDAGADPAVLSALERALAGGAPDLTALTEGVAEAAEGIQETLRRA